MTFIFCKLNNEDDNKIKETNDIHLIISSIHFIDGKSKPLAIMIQNNSISMTWIEVYIVKVFSG